MTTFDDHAQIFQHYDQFNGRYKDWIPLRRVFVPEPIESEE